MPLVSPIDPSEERVSACPVHFLWDGRGKGRALVRFGFLGLAAAAACAVLRFVDVAAVVAAVSAVVYGAGQVVSFTVAARRG
jgi:hypothetical protein